MFKCTNCGHEEPIEQEIRCWECGKGDMLYIGDRQGGIGKEKP